MNRDPELPAGILKAVGRRVAFQYPADEGQRRGILKDRAVVPSNPGSTGVPYWDVVDLISFPAERDPDWIRIGYYRKPRERLVWGSQTTITEPIAVWRRILVQAAREKNWFRKLLDDVVQELAEAAAQPTASADRPSPAAEPRSSPDLELASRDVVE